ncbi:hypothetical protein GCM10009616_37260 [Microlunatus lacustris]
MLTTFRADSVVLDALRAGAVGFLLKHASPVQIVDAIATVARGEPTVSPSVLAQLIDHVARAGDASAADRLRELTDRERDVALAVAQGLSNADIGRALHLSVGSVKARVSAAMAKLGIENRVQLAIIAHESAAASLAGTDPGTASRPGGTGSRPGG